MHRENCKVINKIWVQIHLCCRRIDSMSELDFEVLERCSPEIIDLCNDTSEENEVEKLDINKAQSLAEIASDLEEGEIKEPVKEVCRYFQRGKCWLGKYCNFAHVGVNSYKMFDSQNIQLNIQNVQPVLIYQPIIIDQSTEGPSDAWDRGLKEARKLLLNAKLKKESDLDFEEKQLYQGIDGDVKDKDFYMSVKHQKRKETSERGSNNLKAISEELLLRKQGEKKGRKNRGLKSLSPVPFRRRRSHSRNSSSSSSCSRCKTLCHSRHESDNDVRKIKSKLERVFSRTFGSSETLKSRKRTSCCSYSCRRSLPKHSKNPNFHRSFSKSPPPLKKKYSKSRHEKYAPRKLLHKQCISPTSEKQIKYNSFSKKERSSSPFLKLLSYNQTHELERCSSDMTVSSINCTSVSTSRLSSEVKELKSPVTISRIMAIDEHNREHINSFSPDINKWLDTIPNLSKGNENKSEISMKIFDSQKKKTEKFTEKCKTQTKPDRKRTTSCSTNDEDLSADELELLKYIPNKNRKKLIKGKNITGNEVKATSSMYNTTTAKQLSPKNDYETKKESSTKTSVKYPPPKIVYDYGSELENLPSKSIHDNESVRDSSSRKSVGSKRDSSTPKNLVTHPLPEDVLDCETNGENKSSRESNNVDEVNDHFTEKSGDTMLAECLSVKKNGSEGGIFKQLEKNIVEQNNNFHANASKKRRSSDSSVERPLTKDQLELLKYVSFGGSFVSKEIQNQTKKNPSLSVAKKAKQKTMPNCEHASNSPKRKSAGPKKVKPTKMSKREQLVQQLKAVELAIAKKKKQANLESVQS